MNNVILKFNSEQFDEAIKESSADQSLFGIKNIVELNGKTLREILKLYDGKHVRIGAGTSFFYADPIHMGTKQRIISLSNLYYNTYKTNLLLARKQEKRLENNLSMLSEKFLPDVTEKERLDEALSLFDRWNKEGKLRSSLEEALHKILRAKIEVIIPGRDDELEEDEKTILIAAKELSDYLQEVKNWQIAKKEGTLARDKWDFPLTLNRRIISIEEYALLSAKEFDLPALPEENRKCGFLAADEIMPARNWKNAYNKVISNKKTIEELSRYLDNWKPFLDRKIVEAFKSIDPQNEMLFGPDSVTIFRIEGIEDGKYWYEGEYGKKDPYLLR
jgi:hypothetical protein